MTNENFYMHLCYYLLTKFSNSSITIPASEWNDMFGNNHFIIKHRMNPDIDSLEVVAMENNEQ